MIVVRYADSSEAAITRSIVDEAFVSVREIYTPRSTAVPAHEDDTHEARLIISLIDDVPVGAALVYVEPRALRISQLAVLPRYRRQGVAGQLILFAGQAACDFGLTELRLNTIQETGNVAIFEKLGFSVANSGEATWCESERFVHLTDVEMVRPCD